jgi:hypothetical protein
VTDVVMFMLMRPRGITIRDVVTHQFRSLGGRTARNAARQLFAATLT